VVTVECHIAECVFAMLSFFLLTKSLKGERVMYEVRGGVIQNDKMSQHRLP